MIKVFKFFLLVLSLLSQVDLLNVPIISDIQSIISLSNNMLNVITENSSFDSLFSSTNSSNNALTEAFDQIDKLINQIDTLDDQSHKTMNILLHTLFEKITINGKLGADIVKLRRYVRRIENLYSAMMGILQEKYENIDQAKLSHSFISTVVYDKNDSSKNIFIEMNGDISDNLDDMLQLVVPGEEAVNHQRLMEFIVKQRKNSDDNDTCNVDIPFQHHLLYTFYNAIVIIEAKAYLLSLFSLKFLQYSQQQDPEKRVEKFQAAFVMRTEQYLLELKKGISKAREIYRCRINKFIPDETYTELRGLFTNYLMSIGQHDLMLMRTEQNCGNCFCQCIKNSNASTVIRTFSLLPQYTETGSNMVVSDIRFVLKKNIIHLQIEQSPLLPGGYLNRSLSSWVPLPNFQHKSDDGTVVEIRDEQELNLLRSVDYTFIDTKQNVMNLDEISAESDHVIIAVRLNHEKPSEQDEDNTSPIQLEIFAIPFNTETGKLIENDGVTREWITPLTQSNPSREYAKEREELKYGRKVLKFEESHLPILKPNMFIKFGQSDQTTDSRYYTVPFIDLRSVDDRNNLSINGIGLFYYDGQEYAGYISLKLLTMDLSKHLNPVMTSQQVEFYSKFYQRGLTHVIPEI